jgi:hypothetical protein
MAAKRLAVRLEAELAEEREWALSQFREPGSPQGRKAELRPDSGNYKLVKLYAAAHFELVRNAMIDARSRKAAEDPDAHVSFESIMRELLPQVKQERYEQWHRLWSSCGEAGAQPVHCYTNVRNEFMSDVRADCTKLQGRIRAAAAIRAAAEEKRFGAKHADTDLCTCAGPHWPSCPLNPCRHVSLIQGHWRGYIARRDGLIAPRVKLDGDTSVATADIRREESTATLNLEAATAVQRAWRGYCTRRQIQKAADLRSALATLELPPGLGTSELEQWLNDDGRMCSLGLDAETTKLNLSYDEAQGAYVLKQTIRL